MKNLDVFNLTDIEKELLQDIPLDNISEIVYKLELYKLTYRERIVELLRDDYPELCVVKSYNKIAELAKLEDTYDVIIDKLSEKELRVIYKLFSDTCDRTALSLELAQFNISFCAVTELNFKELKGLSITKDYSPELLLKRIIIEALARKATDIHFSVEHTKEGVLYPIYYRSGGSFCQLDLFELDAYLNKNVICNFIEKKTNDISLDLTESAGVTTSVSSLFKTHPLELRVSAGAVVGGYHCVIRLQELTTTSLKINELGFATDVEKAIRNLARKNNGITLITGAIRTGKNTTALAMAHEMLKRNISIISYDSPVEVLMPFPQVDYKEDPERLLHCVRLAKKQDVDVAFLNEIPSVDVAFAIKDLVVSSVGVVTTLHLNRIWDLPLRLYEYYGDSWKDIISQINGVVNQKMFGVLCPHCRTLIKTYDIPDEFVRDLLLRYNISEVYKNEGCYSCKDIYTGSYGTVLGKNQPFAEFIIFDYEVRDNLSKLNYVYDASAYLKDYVTKHKNNLEVYMIDAVKRGALSWEALADLG